MAPELSGEALLEMRPAGIQAVVASVTRLEHPAALTLAVGAGDRDRFGFLIEKAVELGATEVIPLGGGARGGRRVAHSGPPIWKGCVGGPAKR